jgi:ribosome biogenesis protein SSF1/2
VKDYTAVATQLGLTHLIAISQTKSSNVVARIGRFMNGPTLHFKVTQYSLVTQVKQAQKKPFESASVLQTPPIVVLNNFGQSEENTVKLMRTTLQNMFPPINVKTVRLSECRRVVLFHLKKDDGLVEMRHYAIRAQPVGINRNIKKILQSKIPDLSQLRDVSEFLDSQAYGAGAASDSEADEEYSKVVLPDKFKGTGNERSQKSAIKLTELGPRMTLELFKVESGLCEGDILFHKFQTKTPEEARQTKERVRKDAI